MKKMEWNSWLVTILYEQEEISMPATIHFKVSRLASDYNLCAICDRLDEWTLYTMVIGKFESALTKAINTQ